MSKIWLRQLMMAITVSITYTNASDVYATETTNEKICCLLSYGGAAGTNEDTFHVGEPISFKYRLNRWVTDYFPVSGYNNVGWNFGDGCSHTYKYEENFAVIPVVYRIFLKDAMPGCTSTTWSANWGETAGIVVHKYSKPGDYMVYADLAEVGKWQVKFEEYVYRAWDGKLIHILPVATAEPSLNWLPAVVDLILN